MRGPRARAAHWAKGRTIHSPHPSQPKNVSFSCKNIEERIAQMTTDNAPRGVWNAHVHGGQ